MCNEQHEYYMKQALALAKRGLYTCHPNPRVGCVVVKKNKVVGAGYHQYSGGKHAEIVALEQASGYTKHAIVYVTLEPCSHFGKTPPCVDALIQAGIAEIFIAISDPFPSVAGQGIEQLKKAGIAVHVGLLEQQAYDLNKGFFSRIKYGRPWMRLKIAMSLDGKIAMASGESQWITTAKSRQDGHHWRAQSDAIITSINTVMVDNPRLTVRGLTTNHNQPLRVILDSDFKISSLATLLKEPGKTLILGSGEIPATLEQLDHVTCKKINQQANGLDLTAVMSCLTEMEINEVLIECGAKLIGSFIQAHYVDELIIYLAPSLLGSDATDWLYLSGLEKLTDKIDLTLLDYKQFDQDIRLRYYVN